MAFVKAVKTRSYYKRFQTKNRRRREGKTDYYARRRLIHQDKNKYDTKKYRLVVRRTNRKIIVQIIYNTIQGDRVLCQANSSELRRFGVEAGLTNYAASYATGLLVARRLLAQLKLGDKFKGVENIDGEYFDIMAKEVEQRPFKAYLDVGLVRTTTGNRVFGAMKGAVDGGLFVPHNIKRFPGHHIEKAAETKGKKGKVLEKGKSSINWAPKEHRDHIFGNHVQGYMDFLKKEKKEKFALQFSKWEAAITKNKVKTLEELYKKVHAEIRKAPTRPAKDPKKPAPSRKVISKPGDKSVLNEDSKKRKWLRHTKLSNAERKERIQ